MNVERCEMCRPDTHALAKSARPLKSTFDPIKEEIMDPLTLASSFASLVGLIGMFKQERKEGDPIGKNDFLEWLKLHNFEEYAEMISNSSDTLLEIEKVLSENHEVVISKLHRIDDVLSTLAKNMDLMGGLAESIYQSSSISDQAIEVLRQLVNSPSTSFMKHRVGPNTDALILMQGGGQVNFEEQRFIDDDLDNLVNFGLLRLSYGSKGSDIYSITRDAAKFINSIDT